MLLPGADAYPFRIGPPGILMRAGGAYVQKPSVCWAFVPYGVWLPKELRAFPEGAGAGDQARGQQEQACRLGHARDRRLRRGVGRVQVTGPDALNVRLGIVTVGVRDHKIQRVETDGGEVPLKSVVLVEAPLSADIVQRERKVVVESVTGPARVRHVLV